MTAVGLRLVPGGRAESQPAPAGLLQELYEKHAAAVYGRCRYLLRDADEARDALHDVFVKVMRSLQEFRSAASPLTWVMRIATHHCLNVLRARKAKWREEIRAVQEHEPLSADRRELVRVLLAAAPEEAQEMAVLYWVDELTQQEIARETGRSLPTVRKRLREFLACARSSLRQALPELALPEQDEPALPATGGGRKAGATEDEL